MTFDSHLKGDFKIYAVNLVFSPDTGKYGPEKTPYFDTFHAVYMQQ